MKRLIRELLVHADKHRGAFPKQKRLTKYSNEEVHDVRMALSASHVRDGVDGLTVRVNKYIEATAPDAESFRRHWSNALGHEPRDIQADEDTLTKLLLDAANNLPNANRPSVETLIEKRRGWVAKSLKRDGVAATEARLLNLTRFLQGLPGHGEPLRQFLARHLDNSHILDEDGLLRGAAEAAVLELVPDADDLDEAYQDRGLLRRVGTPTVTFQGPLHVEFDGTTLDYSQLAGLGLPGSLPEATLQAARDVHAPSWVLYVENPSTWYALREPLPEGGIIVLTDGMPTHATRLLCQALGAVGAPQFHWGDIDAGGLRILACLQACAGVQGILMDEETLIRHTDVLTPLTDAKRSHLQKQGRTPVLQACLRYQGFLEQERVGIEEALEAIRTNLGKHGEPTHE